MNADFALLQQVLAGDCFNPVDRHFSALMLRLSGKNSPELALAAALVSRQLADGHSCVQLEEFSGTTYPGNGEADGTTVICPPRQSWEQALRSCDVVGEPFDNKPLILDASGRLYLHRYWEYERSIAEDLLARAGMRTPIEDEKVLKEGLRRLFSDIPGAVNWQKVAAFAALRRRLCIITGGPGTGKTWTVARILALLLEQPGAEKLNVKLAAPTGKAAARLQESLAQSLTSLDCREDVKARLQAENLSTTLHRLLGAIPNSTAFRHNAENPLPVDILVIDEASMVSLSLMAHLLAAFKRDRTRLILVGDKDQLPPVDPGSVLADVCRAVKAERFSSTFCKAYNEYTGENLQQETPEVVTDLADAVVQLKVNHRTGDAAALNTVSVKVNAGASAEVNQIFQSKGPGGSPIAWQPLPEQSALKEALREIVSAHYLPVLKAASPDQSLEALSKFRILCAVREGPYGMLNLNKLVEEILAEEVPDVAPKIRFGIYPGKPVMVSANNYTLKLFNGDTGVFWKTARGSSLVHFPDEAGGLRAIARERLPEHDTVYAMTVHKSQGSEYDHVLLVLPDRECPVLTRELVYTALTRARKTVRVFCELAVASTAIQRCAQRTSGLPDLLSGSSCAHAGRRISPLETKPVIETGI